MGKGSKKAVRSLGEDAPGATKVVTDDDAALLKKSSMRVVNQTHESSTLNVNMNSDDGSSVRLEMKAVVNSAEESQPADAEACLNQDSEKLTGNEELMKKTKKMKKKTGSLKEPEEEPGKAYCPTADEQVLLENVKVDSAEAQQPGTFLWGLLQEVQALADDIFHEEILEKIQETYQNKYPWKLVVLARKQDPEPEPEKNSSDSPRENNKSEDGALLGFMIYNLRGRPSRSMGILRVAVPSKFRGAGYGKRLMQFAMSLAKSLPREDCGSVVCSSLEESVAFYNRLGFQKDNNEALQDTSEREEDLVPGQVWMKYKLGRPVPKSKTAKKRS